MNNERESFNVKDFLDKIVQEPLDKFYQFVAWTDKDKEEFRRLLNILRSPFDKNLQTTKSKGDRLEELVEFIIRKSYFFEIYKNVRTETNEIDEVIIFSDRGRQALKSFGISRELIPIQQEIFLGECKNYEKNLGVTYVGKFYSLMTVTDVCMGIIFTQKGLSGKAEGYQDAYGLTKILRMIEIGRNQRTDFYILTFTDEDYDKLLEGVTFFELVRAKKLEIQLASLYETFITDNRHEAEEEIKAIVSSI